MGKIRKRERETYKGGKEREGIAKGNEEPLNFSALEIAWNSSLAKLCLSPRLEGHFHKVDPFRNFQTWMKKRKKEKKKEEKIRDILSNQKPAKIATFHTITRIFFH